MKEEFEDILRQQLDSFESEDIPAGLWEGIEQKFAARKVVPFWKKLSVAACALLLVSVGIGVLMHNEEIPQQLSEQVSTPILQKSEIDIPTDAETQEQYSQPMQRLYAKVENVLVADEPVAVDIPQSDENPATENPVNDEPVKNNATHNHADRSDKATYSQPNTPILKKETRNTNRISVKLFASQTPEGGDNNMSGYLALCRNGLPNSQSQFMTRAPIPGTMEGLAFANATKNEEPVTSTTYGLPVRLGLSVGYELNPRWGLNLGVVYTRLNSTLKSGGRQSYFTNDQSLNYIGLPVNVSYNILQASKWRVYASAGEMTEFGTGGDVEVVVVTNNRIVSSEVRELHDLPVQFSVNASAGVEYSFYQGLGFFAEPGMSYHFRDHSDISSIYKSHPLNFNLQLGLRWIINK